MHIHTLTYTGKNGSMKGIRNDLLQPARTLASIKLRHNRKLLPDLDARESPTDTSNDLLQLAKAHWKLRVVNGVPAKTYVTQNNNENCETIAGKFGLDADEVFALNKKRYRGFKTPRTQLMPGTTVILQY